MKPLVEFNNTMEWKSKADELVGFIESIKDNENRSRI